MVRSLVDQLKVRARGLKREVGALALAMRHPRTPWRAKALGLLVVAYALSPVDLIPDFIPVLGLVDDLVLVPVGIALVLRLVPTDVMEECRAAPERDHRRLARIGLGIVVCLWLLAVAGVGVRLLRR